MAKLSKSWIPKTENPFNSSMLKVGEMMEILDPEVYKGNIAILNKWGTLVNLTNLDRWNEPHRIVGRKLQPGESITLTQE